MNDLFWPQGNADAREWDLDITQWRQMCRETYKRNKHEYSPPANELVLIPHDRVRGTGVQTASAYEDRFATWVAVRGTDYAPARWWDLAQGATHEVLLELVPTPDNPFDSCAIAVELDGKKLGNLGSGYSRYAHWKLRQLNHHGFRLFTAGVYRAFYRDEIREVTPEAFISIPTLDDLDLKLRAPAAKRSDFRRLWNALDSELQDQIREDHFHLTDETVARIIGYSHQFPELTLPTQPDTSAIPRELDLVLRDVRLEEAESKRLLRQAEHEARWIEDCNQVAELVLKAFTRKEISERLGIPFGRVSRAIRAMNLQEMATIHQPSRIAEERKDEVLKRAADGQSNAQIEREMNLGKGRCSKILAERGVIRNHGPAGGISDHHLQLMRERLEMGQRALELHLEGFTGKEIAAEIGVAESTVKKRLADARFFRNPLSNEKRLDVARAVRRKGLTGASCNTSALSRGLSDGNILDLIEFDWMN